MGHYPIINTKYFIISINIKKISPIYYYNYYSPKKKLP